MSQTKTITTYKVSAFDSKAAAEGGLCVMVASTYEPSQNEGVIDTTANSNTIKGTGICKCVNPDKFLFTVDSIVYTFNSEGKAANLNSVGMKLLMGAITETLATAGARVTKGFGENALAYDITSLSARDEFAIQALRGLLRTIEDPASLSDTEKRYYCDVAYQWAANMMQSAAYTRQNAVNPDQVSVPDVEGIVGALQAVGTAISRISINGGSSGGSTNTTPLFDAILMAPYLKEINSITSNTDGEIKFTINSVIYEGKTLRIAVYDSNGNILTPNNSYKWKVDYHKENGDRLNPQFSTTDYIEFDTMSNLLSMSLDTQPYYFSDGDYMVAKLVTEVKREYTDIAVDRVRIFQRIESGGNIVIGNPTDTDNNTIPLKVEIDNTESFPITDWREVAVITRQYYNSWFKIIYDSSFSNSYIKIECFDEEGNRVNENRVENWHCRWYKSNGDEDGNAFISSLTEVMSSLKNRVVGSNGGGYLEIIPYDGADPELTIMCIKVYVKTASSGETVNIGDSGLGRNAQNPFCVSMPGYLPIEGNAKSASGLKSNHDDALLFVTPPEYQDFNGSQGSQYSWYTGTGGEDYFKAVLRWLCQEYGEEYNNKIVTFIMKCRPNGRATSILLIYNPGDIDSTTKLPRWSGGTVFTIGGNPSIFSYGTSDYAYFFNQGNVAYASTAGSVSDYSVTSNKLASSSVTKDKLHYNIADDYVTIRTVQTITGNKSLKGNLTFYNDDDKSAEITYQGDAEFNTVTAKNVITSNIIYGSTFSVLDSNYDAITNAVILSKNPGDQTSSTKPLSDFVMSLSMESLCRALLNANISYYFNSTLNQYAFSNPIAMTSSNISNNDYFYYKGTYTDSNNVNWVNPIFRYYAATVLLIIDDSSNYYSYDLPITTRSFPNTSSNAASGLVNAVRAILRGLNVGLMPSQQTYRHTLSSREMIEVKLFIQ